MKNVIRLALLAVFALAAVVPAAPTTHDSPLPTCLPCPPNTLR